MGCKELWRAIRGVHAKLTFSPQDIAGILGELYTMRGDSWLRPLTSDELSNWKARMGRRLRNMSLHIRRSTSRHPRCAWLQELWGESPWEAEVEGEAAEADAEGDAEEEEVEEEEIAAEEVPEEADDEETLSRGEHSQDEEEELFGAELSPVRAAAAPAAAAPAAAAVAAPAAVLKKPARAGVRKKPAGAPAKVRNLRVPAPSVGPGPPPPQAPPPPRAPPPQVAAGQVEGAMAVEWLYGFDHGESKQAWRQSADEKLREWSDTFHVEDLVDMNAPVMAFFGDGWKKIEALSGADYFIFKAAQMRGLKKPFWESEEGAEPKLKIVKKVDRCPYGLMVANELRPGGKWNMFMMVRVDLFGSEADRALVLSYQFVLDLVMDYLNKSYEYGDRYKVRDARLACYTKVPQESYVLMHTQTYSSYFVSTL